MYDILKTTSTKGYLKGAVVIGLPVVFQNMASSLINTLDVFMLGQLGEVEITGASISNQWFLLYCILANGIAAAGGLFISQYWGQQNRKSIHHYMGITFCIAAALSVCFFSLSVICPDRILRLYSLDPQVIREGTSYLRTMALCFVIYAVNITLATSLRSVGQTRVPMIATVVSLICNVCGNYALIFGNFGMPCLGIRGAAVATVFARLAEVSVSSGYILWKKQDSVVYGKAGEYFRIHTSEIKKFFHYGGLVILGEVVYAIGSNLYNVAYKYTGTQAQAALQIIQSFQGIALLFCGGFGTAASVMLGALLGSSQFEQAKKCSRVLMGFSLLFSVISAVAVWLVGPCFFRFFHISEVSLQYVQTMLKIMACTIPLRTAVYMVICGMLRSGGDNLFCFAANVFGVWCVGIPAVFLAAVVFHAPVYVVYLMAALEEVGKLLICGPRVLRGKWLQNLTGQDG